jgi:hypothetical protein
MEREFYHLGEVTNTGWVVQTLHRGGGAPAWLAKPDLQARDCSEMRPAQEQRHAHAATEGNESLYQLYKAVWGLGN